jgi:hypothetical protein
MKRVLVNSSYSLLHAGKHSGCMKGERDKVGSTRTVFEKESNQIQYVGVFQSKHSSWIQAGTGPGFFILRIRDQLTHTCM